MKRNIIAFIIAVLMAIAAFPSAAAGNQLRQGPRQDKKSNDQPQITDDNDYDDIADCWCRESVLKYGYKDIFSIDKNKFFPHKKITRMEYVRMLHRAIGITINYFAAPDITDFYNDVDNDDPGAGELYDLVSVGIIDRKDSFGPDSQLDRDEMIHYTINALKYITDSRYALIEMMPAPFSDDDKIKPEYKNDVGEAVILGLIFGRGNNMLFPREGTTRAEAVAVADRMLTFASSIKSDVAVSALAYESDEGFIMSLIIENHTGGTVEISHNSGQKYDFIIYDSDGKIIYLWSAYKKFTAALTETLIDAGETVEFTEIIENEKYIKIKDRIGSVKAFVTGTSTDFDISTEGYDAILNGDTPVSD